MIGLPSVGRLFSGIALVNSAFCLFLVIFSAACSQTESSQRSSIPAKKKVLSDATAKTPVKGSSGTEPPSGTSDTASQASQTPSDGMANSSGSASSAATTPTGTANSTQASAGPGMLKIESVEIPATIKAGQRVSIGFKVTNSGGPIKGVYGLVQVSAKVLFANVDKTIPIETQETVPAGSSTKAISFNVPSVPFTADANVCVTAYSDKAQTKAISTKFCKNVSLTSG